MTTERPSFASSPDVRDRMQRQARRDTTLERVLRSALHRRGLRYRLQVQLLPRRTSDIVFSKTKIVVDVRSCFWHRCPTHYSLPRANHDWWAAKLATTVLRDEDTEDRLRSAGWTVIVVWEHDDIDRMADHIADQVRSRAIDYNG
jgi:DNA mismatch endonuclease, patch repair protein